MWQTEDKTMQRILELHKTGAVKAMHQCVEDLTTVDAEKMYVHLYGGDDTTRVPKRLLTLCGDMKRLKEICAVGSMRALKSLPKVGDKKSKVLYNKVEKVLAEARQDKLSASLCRAFSAHITPSEAYLIASELYHDKDSQESIFNNLLLLQRQQQHSKMLRRYISYCMSYVKKMKQEDYKKEKTRFISPLRIENIRKDPYGQLKLYCNIFKTIDEFALANSWWQLEDPSRVAAVTERLFSDGDLAGHTLISRCMIETYFAKHSISSSKVQQFIESGGFYEHNMQPDSLLTTFSMAQTELNIYEGIRYLLKIQELVERESKKHLLEYASKKIAKTMTDEQENAVSAFLRHRLLCICGAGGTGKSSVCISAIIFIAMESEYDVVCLAPTHKAKKKLAECVDALKLTDGTTHGEASIRVSTLQAFIKNGAPDGACDTKLLLIVDEASMISSIDMSELISCTSGWESLRLVLCGDPSQCRPIAHGAPFMDMVSSDQVKTVHLTAVKRSLSDDINKLSSLYRHDQPDIYWTMRRSPNSFWRTLSHGDEHVHCRMNTFQEKEEQMQYAISEYKKILSSLQKDMDIKDSTKVRTICATNDLCHLFAGVFREVAFGRSYEGLVQGEICQFKINTEFFKNGDTAIVFQDSNCNSVVIEYTPSCKNEKDKVIEAWKKKNSSEPHAEKCLMDLQSIIAVKGQRVRLRIEDFKDKIMPDSVVTVHKAQGAECDICICLFPHKSHFVRSDVMYTAVSRAKKEVFLVGHMEAFNGEKVRPHNNPPRVTLLGLLLRSDAESVVRACEVQCARRQRRQIPKGLREQVWTTHFGDDATALCYACAATVLYSDFHCAYISARRRRDPTSIQEMRICCTACDNSLGWEVLPTCTSSDATHFKQN